MIQFFDSEMPCYQLLRQGHPRLRGPLVVEVQDIEDLLSHMALPWPKGLLRQAVGGGLGGSGVRMRFLEGF